MTREEVAEIVHGMPSGMDADDYLVELVSRAILREREACAKVVEQYCGAWDDEGYALAQAIRANRSLVTTSKPNYCTPQVTPQVTPEVTGDVDETAKGEQEPVCFLRETSWSYEIAPWNDPNGIPVYTAPPKREWVGIEPQEIGQIWANHKEVYGFGIELEQVLKERNT